MTFPISPPALPVPRVPLASRGRRVASRMVTYGIAVVVVLPYLLSYLALRAGDVETALILSAVSSGLEIIFVIVSLIMILAKSRTLAQQFTGLTTRNADSGLPTPGLLIVKNLLQGVMAVGTLLIGEILISWFSYRDGRTWFDRTVGVVVWRRNEFERATTATLTAPMYAQAPTPAISTVRLSTLPLENGSAPAGPGPMPHQPLAATPFPGPGPGLMPLASATTAGSATRPVVSPPGPWQPSGSPPLVRPASELAASAPLPPALPPAPDDSSDPALAPPQPAAATALTASPFAPPTPMGGSSPHPSVVAWAPPPTPTAITPSSVSAPAPIPEVLAAQQSASPGDVSSPAGADPGDVDETIIDPDQVAILLRFDDGSLVVVEGAVALGRNPVAPSSAPTARPIPFQDPAKRMSKTHLLASSEAGVLTVTDLGSTNGVRVENENGTRRLTPLDSVPLALGDKVHFGGRWFDVSASS